MNLHGKVMNIPCVIPRDVERELDERMELGYKIGHRDARHAAAEHLR